MERKKSGALLPSRDDNKRRVENKGAVGNGSDDDSKRRDLEGDDGGPSPRERDR